MYGAFCQKRVGDIERERAKNGTGKKEPVCVWWGVGGYLQGVCAAVTSNRVPGLMFSSNRFFGRTAEEQREGMR